LYEFKNRQLTENGQRLSVWFRGLPLGASFLSAVADLLVMGPHGAKNVSWGDFAHSWNNGRVMSLLPQFIDGVVCMAATVAETLWDIGSSQLQIRMASVSPVFSFCHLLWHGHRSWHQDAIRLFGLLGGRCSILTGVLGADRFTLDKLLNRSRNWREIDH